MYYFIVEHLRGNDRWVSKSFDLKLDDEETIGDYLKSRVFDAPLVFEQEDGGYIAISSSILESSIVFLEKDENCQIPEDPHVIANELRNVVSPTL